MSIKKANSGVSGIVFTTNVNVSVDFPCFYIPICLFVFAEGKSEAYKLPFCVWGVCVRVCLSLILVSIVEYQSWKIPTLSFRLSGEYLSFGYFVTYFVASLI